jgi:Protein of unknown function (DUF559)
MCHDMTDAEALLWKLIRSHRIAGTKFRHQHPIGRYILDFYCDEKSSRSRLNLMEDSMRRLLITMNAEIDGCVGAALKYCDFGIMRY